MNLQPVEGACKLRVLLHASAESDVRVLSNALEFAGFEVLRVPEAGTLFSKVQSEKPDLVVICPLIPADTDSKDLLKGIEAACATETLPVLFQSDHVISWRGSHIICDTMPEVTNFAGTFLLSRGLVRRTRPWSLNEIRRFGDIELCEADFRIRCSGRCSPLGKLEFNILGALFDAPDCVFDRQTLLRLACGRNEVNNGTRLIDVRLCALRKLLKNALQFDPIKTVRGAGYQLVQNETFNGT